MTAVIVPETNGLNTHSNDLAAPVGSTSVADNVTFAREGRPERRKGFKDYSTNLPDFLPEQLIASAAGDQAYLHLDNGIWYKDASSGNWLRKRGVFGAKSSSPYGVVVVSGRLYYVADNTVISLDLTTGVVSVLAGRFGVSATTDGTGDAARFGSLSGLTTDGTDLFVAENQVIRRIEISTGAVTTIAGTAGSSGTADGTGAVARFSAPAHITYLGGSIFVTDNANNTIRRVAPPLTAGAGVVTTIAGTAGASGSSDGTGAAARFFGPHGMHFDGTDLVVADNANNTIRRIAPPLTAGAGVVTTIAGTAGVGTGSVDGIGTVARFASPRGAFCDGESIYVCDTGNSTIRKIYSSGYVVTFSGISGSAGASPPAKFADSFTVGPD
jgi:hypothetical protein